MTDQPTTADYAAYRDRDRLDLLEARLSAVEARLDPYREWTGPTYSEPRGYVQPARAEEPDPPTLGQLIGAVIVDDRPGGGYVGQHTYTPEEQTSIAAAGDTLTVEGATSVPSVAAALRSALRDHEDTYDCNAHSEGQACCADAHMPLGGLVRDLLDLLDGQDPALRRSAEQHAEAEVAEAEAERVRQRDAARALALQRFSTHTWNTNVTWPCEVCGATQPQGWMGACGDPIVDPPLTFEGGSLEGLTREDEVTVQLTHGG